MPDAKAILREARRLVVLTGAGVSTESGVPDFRSHGGTRSRSEGADAPAGASSIWTQFDPDDFRYERFLEDPRGFWELRARLMAVLDLDRVKPNPAHDAIARASRSPRYRGHVTQNIDGLFHVAGHREDNLIEAHGSARTVRCLTCSRFFPYEVARAAVARGELPPRCPRCSGALKPGTILFGELLHEPDLERVETWVREADVVLIVGSSLVVHPVAGLPQLALERGAKLVIVNREATRYDDEADAIIREPAGVAVPQLLSSF